MAIWTFNCNKCNAEWYWEDEDMLTEENIGCEEVIDKWICKTCNHKNQLRGYWGINVEDDVSLETNNTSKENER